MSFVSSSPSQRRSFARLTDTREWDEGGPPAERCSVASSKRQREAPLMLYVGLDLSRKRLDYCLLDEQGVLLEQAAAPPDRDGLRSLAARVGRGSSVVAAVESMTGARFVHDELERYGWAV